MDSKELTDVDFAISTAQHIDYMDSGNLFSKRFFAIADRLEKLEALAESMASNCVAVDPDTEICYCVFCGLSGEELGDIRHASDCPVETAKRLGVIE